MANETQSKERKPRVNATTLLEYVTRYCRSSKPDVKTLRKCQNIIKDAMSKSIDSEINVLEKKLAELKAEKEDAEK